MLGIVRSAVGLVTRLVIFVVTFIVHQILGYVVIFGAVVAGFVVFLGVTAALSTVTSQTVAGAVGAVAALASVWAVGLRLIFGGSSEAGVEDKVDTQTNGADHLSEK